MVKIKKTNFVSIVIAAVSITSLLAVSCTNAPKGTETDVCIPVPKDTSALGRIDHFIPMDQLEEFKKDFQPQRDSVSRKDPNLFIPESEAFNKAALIEILKDPKSVGIRIYYGVKKGDKRNEFRLILVGVDAQGKDLYVTKGSTAAVKIGGGGFGGEEFGQCTPPCQ